MLYDSYIVGDRTLPNNWAITVDDGELLFTSTASASSSEPIFMDGGSYFRLFIDDGEMAVESTATSGDAQIYLRDSSATGTSWTLIVTDEQLAYLEGTIHTVSDSLDLTLSLKDPNIDIISGVNFVASTFRLNLTLNKVTIPRYIYDPVVSGGCPQCGTFLYKKNGKEIRTEQVTSGRNFEIGIEDRYIRCGRCNFPVKISRQSPHPEGSRAGWGRTDTVQSSTWTA